jgi:hypothetical protein
MLSALTKLLSKVTMPYGGHSDIGLITLLYEVYASDNPCSL